MLFETKEAFIQTVKTFKVDEGLRQNVTKLEAYLQSQFNIREQLKETDMATPFTIERTFNTPIQKMWKAITDKNEMKQWYFDLKEFKPEVGFEFEFMGGPPEKSYRHLCKVTEVIPGKKITYSWRYAGYEGNSFVTWELFEEGNKTRLKLTHAGLETFPASNRDLAKENFSEGWTQIIGTSLKEYVENKVTA